MTSGTAPPEAAPSKIIRSSSSKRSLADLDGASDTRGVEAGPEQPIQHGGGMSKRPSYGSLVNSLQLDEITMF